MNSKFFKVAGITVELRSDFPIGGNTLHPKFKQFEVDGPGDDNVLIHHHFHSPNLDSISNSAPEEIYNKNQWKIYRTEKSWIYNFTSMFPIDPPNSAVGVFNRNYTSLSVHTDFFSKETYENARLTALTLFNNDQVMFAPLLSERNGFIIHANGFDINGNGVLLTGSSGVGKSTLSKMLKKRGYKILCDDRMFINEENGKIWIHGNWCHGTIPDTATGSLPLGHLLFLEQSTENSIKKIHNKKNLVHHLLKSLVQPILEPSGWEKIFEIINTMVRQIDCYRVKFDLSGNICDIIGNISKSTSRQKNARS